MSDIFREVDEDIRRDRMERLFKRYGGVMIGVLVLAVAATAGYKVWESRDLAQRQESTAALVSAISKSAQGPAQGVEALTGYAGTAAPDMAALARFNAAALLARDGKAAEAAAAYDLIAGDAAVDIAYRNAATLLSVMHQLETGDPAQLQSRLQPLAEEGSPWRFSARELTGLLAARAGDTARAGTLFQQLADDTQAPAGVRSRAADLAALYGKT